MMYITDASYEPRDVPFREERQVSFQKGNDPQHVIEIGAYQQLEKRPGNGVTVYGLIMKKHTLFPLSATMRL